jgi:hypothetical protein
VTGRTIEELQSFSERLKKINQLGDDFNAACAAEFEATKRRNAAREAYVWYWIETESMFPDATMPFYSEFLWGPKDPK